MIKRSWVFVVAIAGCAGLGEDVDQLSQEAKTKPPKDKCAKKPKKKCTTTTASVGPTGGTVTMPDGLTMQVPYGALDTTTTLSVTATTLDPDPALGGAGTVYAFEPEGLVFARPVDVTLPLPVGLTQASVYWTRINSQEFEPIGGTIAAGKITASTFHFSLAQVGAPAHSPVIRGQRWTTWISEYGRKNRSTQFDVADITAIVADGTNFASFGASPVPTSDTDPTPIEGEFKIENVPTGGDYIARLIDHDGNGDQYVVTSDAVIDLGIDRGGDPDRAEVPGMRLDLTVDLDQPVGTSTWNANSTLEFVTTRADNFGFGLEFVFDGEYTDTVQIAPGAHTANMNFDLQESAGSPFPPREVLGSQGDNTVVAQLTGEVTSDGVPYQSMRWVGHFPLVDLAQVTPAPISVDLPTDIRTTPKILNVDFRGDHFWDAIVAETPNTLSRVGAGFGVLAQGYDAAEGFYTGNLDLLLAFDQQVTSDPCQRITGVMEYGDSSLLGGPTGGTFGDLFEIRCATRTLYKLPHTQRAGAGAFGANAIRWTRAVPTTPGMVIEPPLTAPHNVQIEGQVFTAGGPLLGTARPTITWDKPVKGKDAAHCMNPDVDASDAEACIAYYTITAREMSINANQVSIGQAVARVVTPHTSFQFPDVLDPTKTYTFTVGVVGGTTGDAVRRLRSMPLRPTLNEVTATVSSGVFGDLEGTFVDPIEVQRLGDSQYPMGLAIDGTKVFWIEHGDSPWDEPIQHTLSGRLWRANADGTGTAEILVDNLPEPQSISIDNGTVYWTNMANNDGSIQFVDATCTAPCSAQTLIDHVGGVSNGNGLVAKDGDVFWLGQGVQVIRAGDPCRSSALPCMPEPLAPIGGVSIDADATNVYWTDYGAGQVLAIPRTGGFAIPIANGGAQSWDVHVGTGTHAGFVYYGNQAWQQPFPAWIDGVPNNNTLDPSANHVRVATGTANGTDDPPSEIMKVFGIDATDAFYIDTYDRLMRAPLDGSGAVLVGFLPEGGCPQGNIAIKDRVVYWTDTCSQAVHYYALP